MNKVEIPSAVSVTGWNSEKAALAKDKAVASKLSGETSKLADAIKALDSAAGKVDFNLGDPKGIASASAAEAALAKLEELAKGAVKTALGAAKLAAAAADTFAAAAEKAQKGLPAPSQKVAVAAKGAAAAASKAADKFASDLSAAVDEARSEMEAAIAKLKAGDKKSAAAAPAKAPAKLSPKAMADGKNLAALMRKSIALLRSPKGPPAPVKFMVLFNKANPKELRLYLGPKPESGLAKLKTQFQPDVKVTRVKDPKGHVVWDKGALTFLSDILKAGLAKQVQLAIRAQTKVTVKVRIKRSDGAVDEADAKDVSDDELKVSPADEAEMLAAGKAYEARLTALRAAIQAALKGPNAKKVKDLEDAIRAAGSKEKFDVASDGIDELESLLEEGDVADSDGKDLEADTGAPGPGDKNVAPATALKAKLAALKAKIDGASADVKKYRDGALALLEKEGKANVDNAAKFVTRIEEMLAAATKSSLPVAKLEAARSDWIKSRDAAIKGITDLSMHIAKMFASETAQKKAVADAVRKLGDLQIKLQTGLDNELNMAIKAKDPGKQADLVDRARDSLASLQDLMEKDDLLVNLDDNDTGKKLTVVGNMKKSLKAIEDVLG
jgi:hypothetical protein